MEYFKLGYPIENFDIASSCSQYFGVNRSRYYRDFGLPAHNGIDVIKAGEKLGYGTKILAMHDYESTSVSSDFPTKTIGTSLKLRHLLNPLIKVNGKTAWYVETIYGHLADITLSPIQQKSGGKKGDIVALMGNVGYVFPRPHNGCAICPYLGTHTHIGLVFYDSLGKIIQNDYNGRYDPIPYLYNKGDKLKMRFDRDLFIGRSGDDVSSLQTILKIEGFAEDYSPIGYYGTRTLRDVRKLQQKHGITPSYGFCGVKTRRYLSSRYLKGIFS